VRGVLVESILLAITGGVLGIAVAYAVTKMIVSLAFQIGGPNNYVPLQAAPSWPTLLFTLVVSMLIGVVFGIAPAWMASHADLADALRGAGVRLAQGAPGHKSRW
jgi:putative ABC transport system permease protein